MKTLVTAIAFVAGLSVADNTLTGTWEVQTEVMGNAGSAVCTLQQDGNTITGKCYSQGADQTVTGEVKDGQVTFKHGGDYNGQTLTLVYNGKFESATSLVGQLNVQPYDVDGTFKATRK